MVFRSVHAERDKIINTRATRLYFVRGEGIGRKGMRYFIYIQYRLDQTVSWRDINDIDVKDNIFVVSGAISMAVRNSAQQAT